MKKIFSGWEKVIVSTETGPEEAIAPLIISASRSTDIPSFYTEWLLSRIQAGYSKWINPYSKKSTFVSFEKARVFVFWTKRPFFSGRGSGVEQLMDVLDKKGIGYYWNFTLNAYDEEKLEPNLPPLEERISLFRRLSERTGPERVIWRFDPLLISKEINVQKLIRKISFLLERVHGYTGRLILSFIDINCYSKVASGLKRSGHDDIKELRKEEIEELACHIRDLCEEAELEIFTCAEEIDLEKYGIKHGACIDGNLMRRLFSSDRVLVEFLGSEEEQKTLKDRGQRKACRCIVSKDIGQYDTCPHLCVYCYAISSPDKVLSCYSKYLMDSSRGEAWKSGPSIIDR